MPSPVFEICKERIRPYYLRWLYFRLFPEVLRSHFPGSLNTNLYKLKGTRTIEPVPVGGDAAFDVLFLPMTDWHIRIQRSQHLASGLATNGHRCFYLNPHLGRELPGVPVPFRTRAFISPLQSRIFELHAGLDSEPICHRRLLHAREERAIVDVWRRLFSAFKVRRAVQIVSLPTWASVSEAIRDEFGFPVVYDCHDYLGGFEQMARPVVERETEFLRSADLTLFSSEWLASNVGGHRDPDRTLILRNGVDFPHFESAFRQERPVGRRTIGYVGSLNHWLEVNAIRCAACRYPEWRFVLFGRAEHDSVRQLEQIPNVEFGGEIPYSEVPARLASFDVGLIPFLKTPLTLATNPIKLYEYFSAGLPVVSTRLPEVESFRDLVYLADTPDDFACQVGRAANEQDTNLRIRRREIAQCESWAARTQALTDAIRRLLVR